jgi:elongation factor P
VRVIASSLRKGNIVEIEGKLGVIVSAENIHPGKGTPVTQLDVRRIADGVKVSLRYKTTDQVERAFVEDRKHQYLYHDGDGFHFMNMESYDQVALPADIIGEQAAYLQPEMEVTISLHDGVPVAIELPPRAVLEVVETEPTVKGQTAASSYKPALLSNGVRTMVPTARPGMTPQKNASVRISMLSRGRALGGEVGSSKAVCAVQRARPSLSASKTLNTIASSRRMRGNQNHLCFGL